MIKLISLLIPKSLKSFLYKYLSTTLSKFRRANQKWSFNQNIRSELLANTILLSNREQMLAFIEKGGVLAEIGVNKGEFSQKILTTCQPAKLHLVDAWHSKRYNNSIEQFVREKFKKETENNIIEINKGFSTEVLNKFPDSYFDWVYIDTDHTFPTTVAELKLCKDKVKPGGVIAGHDFIYGDLDSGMKNGVIEAVYQFCNEHNWELIYLTMELDIPPSFAIRKKI